MTELISFSLSVLLDRGAVNLIHRLFHRFRSSIHRGKDTIRALKHVKRIDDRVINNLLGKTRMLLLLVGTPELSRTIWFVDLSRLKVRESPNHVFTPSYPFARESLRLSMTCQRATDEANTHFLATQALVNTRN